MTTSGSAGLNFSITETNVVTATGTVTQTHTPDLGASALTVATTDVVFSVSGSVGTTAFDFDLNNVVDQSGTGFSTSVVRNQAGNFATMKSIIVHNTHATGVITLGPGVAQSYLPAGEQITVQPGSAIQFVFVTADTVGASNGRINIVSDTASTTFEMYLLGT